MRAIPLLGFALMLCALGGPSLAAAAPVKKHFCFTMANELWNNYLTTPNGCTNPNSATCTGGLFNAMAYVRDMQNRGEPTFLLWDIDHVSGFVQMHPDGWNVNMRFMKQFGIGTFVAQPSVFQSPGNTFTLLRDPAVKVLSTNSNIPPDNPWFAFRNSAYLDASTGIAVLGLTAVEYSGAYPNWRGCLLQQLDILSKQGNVKHVVLFDLESLAAMGAGNLTGLIQEMQAISPIKIDAVYSIASGKATQMIVVNGTYGFLVAGNSAGLFGLTAGNLACLDLTVESTTNAITAGNYSLFPLSTVPAALKTSQYYADVAFTQLMGDQASSNNPTVGYTTLMPASLTATTALCRGGECASGNVWTDACKWQTGSDVACWNTGGIRGPGWPAGAVHMGDLFASVPFADWMVTRTMQGITLWEMFNFSISQRNLTSDPTAPTGVLMQCSGTRITYSPDLPNAPTRLLSIDVYNTTTKVWEPLDRLRLYKVTATVFELELWGNTIAALLNRVKYDGETAPVSYTTLTLHRVVANYLTATTTAANPRVVALDGRFKSVSNALPSQAMNWYQSPATCAAGTYWVATRGTCMPCPAGLTSSAGTNICVTPASDNTTVLVAVLVPLAVILLVLSAIAAVLATRAKGGRNVANAPKSGRVTLLFTDIENSTRLWGTIPLSMSVALEQHHTIMRQLIEKHKAYEVKTVGDSFMIAVSSEAVGVALAMDIQRELQAAQWPAAIGELYLALATNDDDKIDAVNDDPTTMGKSDPALNGIRVRVGVHCGEPSIVLDEVTKGYDYYGPMVNIAARVESVANGGQVCGSAELVSKIGTPDGVSIRVLGKVSLKGVAEPFEVHELMPAEFTYTRKFALRDVGDDGAVEDKNDTGSASSTQTGAGNPETDLIVQHSTLFFKNMLRVMKPADAKIMRSTALKAWHIEDAGAPVGAKAKDASMDRLCRRISLGIAKDIRKLTGNQDQSSQSSTKR